MKRIINSLLFLLFAVILQAQQAKYVFYFIGDGMGMNLINVAELFMAQKEGFIGVKPLVFTQFPIASMATSFSATHPVTDSAAAGTALATGHKTYNKAIGVDVNKEAIESVAVRAQKSGKKVGIATSVSIDHATPAAFYAHQPNRNMCYEIALDLVKTEFDFYAGSGFISPETTFKKEAAPSIFPIIAESGYVIAKGNDDFFAKQKNARKMILIQEEGVNPISLPYAIDRKAKDLSLRQITENAISFLMKEQDKGFFLMIEGGKIDWACHSNDAATAITEVLDLNEAVKIAYDFYEKHPKETLIVVTADHETGGLGVGKGKYDLNLATLGFQQQSADSLSIAISKLREQKKGNVSWEDMKLLLSEAMGFWKDIPLSWKQERKLHDEFERSFAGKKVAFDESLYSKTEPMAACAKEVMTELASLSWVSGGHSGAYVPVYAIGAGSDLFKGKIDNTDIPKRIALAGNYKK